MSFIEGVGREQQQLFPKVLDDYVAAENPVRFIDAFVRPLDIGGLGFERAVPAETGRPGYDPRDLLALYIYGYLYGIRSSRKLEKETHRNVELMWLLRWLRPDFKTIADFRRDNGPGLRKVCREFTLLCKRMDLFGAELVAIDGSKFRAVNSRDRNFSRVRLEEMLGQIDTRIEQYLGELDAQDGSEAFAAGIRVEDLPRRIEQLQEQRSECRALLEHLERAGEGEVSLTDPDSRRMLTGGVTDVCYNVQIAVDEKNKLIVAQDVTNSVSDRQLLAPMAKQARQVLSAKQLAVVADRGYTNNEQVKQCAQSGIVPYMGKPQNSRNQKLGLFTKDDFVYDEVTDTYRCPAGETLSFHTLCKDRRSAGRLVRYYWTNACTGCALRSHCTRDGRRRRINRNPDEHFVEDMRARVAAAPEILRRRKAIVEHPFGTMKRWMNQGYFLTRGLQSVRAEFSLTVLAYNLKRAFALLTVPRMVTALA
jgi:transposase